MPRVDFEAIQLLGTYSRPTLAQIWGYTGFQALARGVVTPANARLIILFVTKEKQKQLEQYADSMEGDCLHWEGPTDHYAEDRLIAASETGEEIHLFYRDRHHSEFVYYGRLQLQQAQQNVDRPSRFVFRLLNAGAC